MTSEDLLERAADLRRGGQPFVLATVVRVLRPASARPGDRALILADRRTVGWVGGGCVHNAIEREALLALSDRTPRLVRLSPDQRVEEGITSYPMTCHSGGTLEIYLEPVLPAPRLLVVGDSPVADALRTQAEPLGFNVVSSLDEVSDLADTWLVAAAMGTDEDEPAIKVALERGISYAGIVASRRRTEAVVAALRAEGVAEEALANLKGPAGLDIGAATAPEIALSILAEIIQRRRSRPTSIPESRRLAVDPVCGMEVDPATARWSAERDGQTFYFCAPGCRKAFLGATV